MATNYDKFDEMVDVDGLLKDMEEAEKNGWKSDYPDVPAGRYEVSVKTLELGESKKGKPMVKIQFKILNGDFKNSILFYNQVVDNPFGIHNVNEIVNALTQTDCMKGFKSYKQFAQDLLDAHETIDNVYEYAIDYCITDKGFPEFKVAEVFALED